MVQYRVKRINLDKVTNTDEYWNAVKYATVKYCNGIRELQEYCGGKLHRVGHGYSGINGNIEYIAEKVGVKP